MSRSSYDLALKLLRLSGSPHIEEARTAAYLLARMIDRGEVHLIANKEWTGKCTWCGRPIVNGVYARGYGVRCARCI